MEEASIDRLDLLTSLEARDPGKERFPLLTPFSYGNPGRYLPFLRLSVSVCKLVVADRPSLSRTV